MLSTIQFFANGQVVPVGQRNVNNVLRTVNGQYQPVCTFLGKGPPSSTMTQEGLAVITEIFAFASHPGRVRRLTNRIEGVALAEAGANFLEVFRYFQSEGYDPPESYQLEYGLRSLRLVNEDMKTVKSHVVEIVLPSSYPRLPPQCRMLTPFGT